MLLTVIATLRKRVPDIAVAMEIMTRTHSQSLIWRAYTVFMLLAVGVWHLRHIVSQISIPSRCSSIVMLINLLALIGWAFGFQFGTKATRRSVAIVFAITTAWALFWIGLGLLNGRAWAEGWASMAASLTASVAYLPMCVALFRYGSDHGGKSAATAEVLSRMPSSRIETLNRYRVL